MIKKKLFLPLLLSLSFSIQANISKKFVKSRKNLLTIKKNLQVIEKNLNKKNISYLNAVKRRQKLDYEIYDLNKLIEQSYVETEKLQEKLNVNYKRILLNSIDNESSGDLLERKIVLKRLKKQRNLANSQLKELQNMRRTIIKLKEEFTHVVGLENELFDAVKNLESKKQTYANSYLNKKVELEKIKISLKKSKKTKEVKNINRTFIHPIEKYSSIDHNKKGIYYLIKEAGELKASKAGTVVHSGTLANYGNVLMIDHGKEYKSIYLGNFNVKTKKGARVKQGQIIGYTQRSLSKGAIGKVYFEIRKKDKVRNTIKYVKAQNTRI